MNIEEIIEKKGLDKNTLRLNIGGGNIRYSNCINLELQPHDEVDADIYGDITHNLPDIPDNTFHEILMIHVIEHIERKFHMRVLDEVWRILKPNGRFVLAFPDIIEVMKRFIENKYGGRWRLYHNCIFGRQGRPGDYHVTGIERQDITDKLFSTGFVNVKYLQHTINSTLTCYKGPKLTTHI